MAKRAAAGTCDRRMEPPREEVVRCNNAMALWHRVLVRPTVLAPVLGPPVHGVQTGVYALGEK